jgi:hypothetical protein
MTQVLTQPRRPQTTTPTPADRRPTAEQLLRDAAFVLHLTRRVRAEVLRDQRETRLLAATAA